MIIDRMNYELMVLLSQRFLKFFVSELANGYYQSFDLYIFILICMTSPAGKKRRNSSPESFEVGQGVTEQEQCEGSGKEKQKDFVKRNIKVCQSSCWAKCNLRVYHMTEPVSCLFVFPGWKISVSSSWKRNILSLPGHHWKELQCRVINDLKCLLYFFSLNSWQAERGAKCSWPRDRKSVWPSSSEK